MGGYKCKIAKTCNEAYGANRLFRQRDSKTLIKMCHKGEKGKHTHTHKCSVSHYINTIRACNSKFSTHQTHTEHIIALENEVKKKK